MPPMECPFSLITACNKTTQAVHCDGVLLLDPIRQVNMLDALADTWWQAVKVACGGYAKILPTAAA